MSFQPLQPFYRLHKQCPCQYQAVLIIEAMAQAGAVAILSMEENKGKIAYFGGIDKAKFRGKVTPGDTLRFEVEIVKLKKMAGIGKGIAYVGDKKVAEAEMTFMF